MESYVKIKYHGKIYDFVYEQMKTERRERQFIQCVGIEGGRKQVLSPAIAGHEGGAEVDGKWVMWQEKANFIAFSLSLLLRKSQLPPRGSL